VLLQDSTAFNANPGLGFGAHFAVVDKQANDSQFFNVLLQLCE
jgi:hypothetical protein